MIKQVFGLLHTFSEAERCDDIGDAIEDTPSERYPNTEGCNVQRDTCPDHPGKDPVQVSDAFML